MAWPEKTQFKSVERLPVPPEVGESFSKLRSANISRGYASSSRNTGGGINWGGASKAASKVETATQEAAGHFGGDTGKMMTHFNRWIRWKGAAMNLPDNPLLSRESANKAMEKAGEVYETPAIRKARVKPTRRGA